MKNKILIITLMLAILAISITAVQAGCSDGICCDKDLWAKLSENEVHTARANNFEYEMEVLVISETSDEAKFKINGEITDALSEGEEDTLSDGSVIEVKKILSENGVSKVIICFDYGVLKCSGVVGELNDGETEHYMVGDYAGAYEYEVEASVYKGNFRLKVNGEMTDWLGIGSEQTMADGLKVKILYIGSDRIRFCMTPGPATSSCKETTLRQGEQHNYRIGNDHYTIGLHFVDTDTDNPKAKIKINGQMSQALSAGETYRFGEGSSISELKIFSIKRDGSKYQITYCIKSDRLVMSEDIPEQEAESSQPEDKIDLSNYPELFIKGKSLNGIFVVGDQAPADDVIAAIDISMSFQKYGVSKTGEAMLASEVNHYKRNIISVGRPCDNAVTAQILRANGISDYDFDCSYGLKPGQAMVYLFDYHGYAHLLVFGYSRLETRQAARQLTFQKMKGRKQLLGFTGGSMPQPEEPEKIIPEEITPSIPEPVRTEEEPEHREPQVVEDADKDCPGCRKNGACMQIGIRFLEGETPVYCDIDHAFKPQLENGKRCQNNYECLSNTCQDGACQSMGKQIESIQKELQEQKGILEKILGFFKRIFSF